MLSKYFIALISPLGTAILVALVAFILVAIGRCKLGIYVTFLSIFWLYIWSMPIVSYKIRFYLESAYPPIELSKLSKSDAIVVLGGGIAPSQSGFSFPNLNAAADRIYQAARIYKIRNEMPIVLSGGSNSVVFNESEASAMSKFIQDLGVPISALILEESSLTTADNAFFTSRLLKRQSFNHIILVTSALHMERAKLAFEHAELIVEPSATDYEARFEPYGLLAYLPDTDALDGSARAIKEIVGVWTLKMGWYLNAVGNILDINFIKN